MTESKSKNDVAWEQLFDKYKIINALEELSYFEIYIEGHFRAFLIHLFFLIELIAKQEMFCMFQSLLVSALVVNNLGQIEFHYDEKSS